MTAWIGSAAEDTVKACGLPGLSSRPSEISRGTVSTKIKPGFVIAGMGAPTLSRPRSNDPHGTANGICAHSTMTRSEEHTSELQSLMRISYAVFCLKKKKK